jgi:hypothetical protein
MRMIEKIADGDSNTIRIINRQLVEKRFVLKEQLQQEMTAYSLYQLVSPFRVPIILDKNDNSLTMEFVSGQTGFDLVQNRKMKQADVTCMVADFTGSIFWKMQLLPESKIRLFNQLSFKNRITQMQSGLEQNNTLLTSLIGRFQVRKFRNFLRSLLRKPELFINQTLVHRDLHMSNLLINQLGNSVIDFEHALIGPIELEIQNALFWNDDYSIDPKLFRAEIVNNMRVPYSIKLEKELLTFYVIDQILIALKRGEMTKVRNLIRRFRRLRKILN